MAVYSDIIKCSYLLSENSRYDFSFNILASELLSVYISDADSGGDKRLKHITDYEIELNNDGDGGHIILTPACMAKVKIGAKLTIIHTPEFTQEIKLQENDTFYIKTIEDMVDKLTYLVLSLKESISRAVMLPYAMDNRSAYEDLMKLINDCEAFAKMCERYSMDVSSGGEEALNMLAQITEIKNDIELHIKRANEDDALAGVDNDKIMTPYMVKKFADSNGFIKTGELDNMITEKNIATRADIFKFLGMNTTDPTTYDSTINYITDFTNSAVPVFASSSGKIINFGGPNYNAQLAISSIGEIAARSKINREGQNFSNWKRGG